MIAYMDTALKLLPSTTDAIVMKETNILEWMTKGKTTKIQKDFPKRQPFPTNTDPTHTCLPIMWKILTAQILKRRFTIRLHTADSSLNNRNDAARDQEKQNIHYTLVNTYSKSTIPGEKISLGHGLILKKEGIQYGRAKLDDRLSKCTRYPTNLSRKPSKTGEWNWQLREKVLLRRTSREESSREMRYLHYYL